MLNQGCDRRVWTAALVAVAVALCWPLHVFPMGNYMEELFVGLAVLLLLAVRLWFGAPLRVSQWVPLWCVFGGLLLFSCLWHPASFVAGKTGYLLFWVCGLAALLLGDQLDWTTLASARRLAWVLTWLAVIGGVAAVLRHYGLIWSGFSWLVPDVSSNRMIGLVGHANFFAYVCLLGIFALAWLYEERRIGTAALTAALLLLLYCMVCSGGRSVLLAWAAALVLVVWRWRALGVRRFPVVLALALLAYVVLRPLMGAIDQWLSQFWLGRSTLDQSLFELAGRGLDSSGRVLEWKIAWRLFLDHWLLGIGVGNYTGAAFAKHLELGIPSVPGLFTHSHNSPLQLLVELGVLGGLWLIALCVLVAIAIRRVAGERARILALTVLAIFAVYGLFEFPLWMMHFFVLNLLLLGSLSGRQWVLKLRFGRVLGGGLGLVCLAVVLVYAPFAERFYWSYRQYLLRETVLSQEYQFIDRMLRDPLLEPYAYYIYLANFQIAPASLEMERKALERLVSFNPYHQVLIRLAVVAGLQGDMERAQNVVADMRLYYGDMYNEQLKDEVAGVKSTFPERDLSPLLR